MLERNIYCDIIIITLDVLWHACWIPHFLYVHYIKEKKGVEGGQGEERRSRSRDWSLESKKGWR